MRAVIHRAVTRFRALPIGAASRRVMGGTLFVARKVVGDALLLIGGVCFVGAAYLLVGPGAALLVAGALLVLVGWGLS